jgi:hypothetical protein
MLQDDISSEKVRVRAKIDEFNVGKYLDVLRATGIHSMVTSTYNIGVVSKYIGFREFGFILDKHTQWSILFHKCSVVQEDKGDEFRVGEEPLIAYWKTQSYTVKLTCCSL